jgi:hypothetical protein
MACGVRACGRSRISVQVRHRRHLAAASRTSVPPFLPPPALMPWAPMCVAQPVEPPCGTQELLTQLPGAWLWRPARGGRGGFCHHALPPLPEGLRESHTVPFAYSSRRNMVSVPQRQHVSGGCTNRPPARSLTRMGISPTGHDVIEHSTTSTPLPPGPGRVAAPGAPLIILPGWHPPSDAALQHRDEGRDCHNHVLSGLPAWGGTGALRTPPAHIALRVDDNEGLTFSCADRRRPRRTRAYRLFTRKIQGLHRRFS